MIEHYHELFMKLNEGAYKKEELEIYSENSQMRFCGLCRRVLNLLKRKHFAVKELEELSGMLQVLFHLQVRRYEMYPLEDWLKLNAKGLEENELTKKYIGFFNNFPTIDDLIAQVQEEIKYMKGKYQELYMKFHEGNLPKIQLEAREQRREKKFFNDLDEIFPILEEKKTF